MERLRFIEQYGYQTAKWLFSGVCGYLGSFIATFEPILEIVDFFIILTVLDMISARRLSKRVRAKHPDSNDGKISSDYLKRFIKNLALGIFAISSTYYLHHQFPNNNRLIETYEWTSILVCVYQIISIIENSSSCSEGALAKVFQSVLADKTYRHLNNENISQVFEENNKVKQENTELKKEVKKLRKLANTESNAETNLNEKG